MSAPLDGPTPAAPRFALACHILLAAGLFLLAIPGRWHAARGDLWYDEADYAVAAVRGFDANRWDRSGVAEPADHLIRLRHYHPPLGVQALGLALRWGREERTLRLPSILAGALTVALLYACGVLLFRARSVAVACAVLLAYSPPHIRVSSHALPWVWVTLWLVALLATLLAYTRSGRAPWLVLVGGVLGAMFVSSEYLVPTAAVLAPTLVVVLWPLGRLGRAARRAALRDVLRVVPWSLAAFLVIAATLWPAGLTGGAVTMLRHYVEMADDPFFPVRLLGRTYEHAPKWAYLYWYWDLYPGFLLFSAAGTAWAAAMAGKRRLGTEAGALAVLTVGVVAIAHGSHIIGPQYLAHAVPFLLLLGGLVLVELRRAFGKPGLIATAACCAAVLIAPEKQALAGMEPRALEPRWPAATAYLQRHWSPGDRLLASQYGVTARWYLVHYAGLAATEDDIRSLPASGARKELLWEVRAGKHRWALLGNSLADWAPVDNRLRLSLQHWRVAWRSPETPGQPSRLVLYEFRPESSPLRTARRATRRAAEYVAGRGSTAARRPERNRPVPRSPSRLP